MLNLSTFYTPALIIILSIALVIINLVASVDVQGDAPPQDRIIYDGPVPDQCHNLSDQSDIDACIAALNEELPVLPGMDEFPLEGIICNGDDYSGTLTSPYLTPYAKEAPNSDQMAAFLKNVAIGVLAVEQNVNGNMTVR